MSQPNQKVMPKIRMLRGGRPQSAIKITNVKSIKPPDPEILKKQEEASLREQVQKEIESRARTCAHRAFECTETVLSGQSYCSKHILSDPSAPYKQCAHVFTNGQRCTQLAPIVPDQRDHRDQGVCFEHARAALLARGRSAAPPPPRATTETLLNRLTHYITPERTRTTSCASSVSVVSEHSEQEQVSNQPIDPFKQIDASSVNASVSASIMECGSDSSSDGDSVVLGEGGDCRAPCEHSALHEHAPAHAAPLWNAGVYTLQEALEQTRLALRSLKAAYLEQTSRQRTLLLSARADFLKSLRSEKETYCSIHTQAKSGPLTVRERRQLRVLKALLNYRKPNGVEAVLARKLHRKRAKVNESGLSRPVPSVSRCTFVEGGVRCDLQGLPAAKFCRKHILLDKHQVLFTACSDPRGGAACREPVARLPAASPACRYHAGQPPYNDLALRSSPKKEDAQDALESHSTTDESQLEQVEDAERSSADKMDTDFAPDIDTLHLDPLPFA